MTGDPSTEKITVKGLIENPADTDRIKSERELFREVNDSRPIEAGDVIFDKSSFFNTNDNLESTTIEIKVATFKPNESSRELVQGQIPYEQKSNIFMESISLVRIIKYEMDGSLTVEFPENKTAFTFEDDYDHIPMKSVYSEIYDVSNAPKEPVLATIYDSHILQIQEELPALGLTSEQNIHMLEKSSEARRFLAQNLPDVVDESTGFTDPRLQQMDSLINYLSTQIYFKRNN